MDNVLIFITIAIGILVGITAAALIQSIYIMKILAIVLILLASGVLIA